MVKCGGCGKFLSVADGVCCGSCSGVFHGLCVNIPGGTGAPPDWLCPACKAKLPRGSNCSTPVKGVTSGREPLHAQLARVCARQPERDHDPEPVSCDDTAHDMTVDLDLAVEIRLFRSEQQAARAELREYRNEVRAELAELRQDVTVLRSSNEAGTKKISDLENKVRSLEETVATLQSDAAAREQRALLNDIELSGIPESEGESAAHITMVVAKKLGVSLEERDVVSVRRVGARREAGGAAGGGSAGSTARAQRPRPIAVSFLRRAQRDDMLKSARVRRGITTENMGLPQHEPARIFVNERLTKLNRILLGKTREAAKLHKWAFVWTRDGQVHVRRDKTSALHRIYSEDDVKRLFH